MAASIGGGGGRKGEGGEGGERGGMMALRGWWWCAGRLKECFLVSPRKRNADLELGHANVG